MDLNFPLFITYPKSIVELKQHFILIVFVVKSVFGMVSRSKEEAPFNNVTIAINSRKLPKVSANIPANGGPKISATGITLLTIAASSMLKPMERICKVR